MKELIHNLPKTPKDREALDLIRKALLEIDRLDTREKGQRRLKYFAEKKHSVLSPIAHGGLASSYLWSGDMNKALYWCLRAVHDFPLTPAALWCSSLLVSIYKTLGMKRERFEAEGKRLQIMKKMLTHSDDEHERIVALNELRKEFEARDCPDEANRCSEELQLLLQKQNQAEVPSTSTDKSLS